MPRRSSARPRAPMRAAPPPPPPPQQQPPPSSGSGLFGQMAATAGGVAVGSAVGHAVGNALFGGQGEPVPQQQQEPIAKNYGMLQKPCEIEVQQFLECTKTQDLSLCDGFNQILKECRARYNV